MFRSRFCYQGTSYYEYKLYFVTSDTSQQQTRLYFLVIFVKTFIQDNISLATPFLLQFLIGSLSNSTFCYYFTLHHHHRCCCYCLTFHLFLFLL